MTQDIATIVDPSRLKKVSPGRRRQDRDCEACFFAARIGLGPLAKAAGKSPASASASRSETFMIRSP
jgi:hypothetical protein